MLTVAVCTWNRAEVLRRALASLVDARPPAASWEVVVVDNGCTDHTPAVVDAFAARLPVRRIVEPRPGLSNARNAAVAAARGRWILWTDDDVVVEGGWLAEHADAMARHPDAALLGGPIRARFDGRPPRWAADALDVIGNAWALLDLGPAPRPLDAEHLPFGANYAVRTDMQRRHLYSPDLGRIRRRLGAGEETAVARAILAEGGTGWWVPGAVVGHVIPAERQSLRYLRRYYLGNGASVRHRRVPRNPTWFGRPRWIWRQAVQQELLFRLTRPFAHPRRWTRHFRLASEAMGMLLAPFEERAPDGRDATTVVDEVPVG